MNYTKEERLQLAHDIIRVMNSAVALDKAAVSALACKRVICNSALAEHPTIQVRTEQTSTSTGIAVLVNKYSLGLVGLLNGIAGKDEHGNGYIAADFDNNTGELIKFCLNPNAGNAQ